MNATVYIQLETARCCNCGVIFGLETEHRARLLNTHDSFYCPNGHGQHFTGKNEAERLKEELAQKAAQLTAAKDEALALKMKCEQVERAFTRHRKRSAAGVCPCCQRTFTNMARHMKTKHPEFK